MQLRFLQVILDFTVPSVMRYDDEHSFLVVVVFRIVVYSHYSQPIHNNNNNNNSHMTCPTRPQRGDVPTVPLLTPSRKESVSGVLYCKEEKRKKRFGWI
jgi:hypothetical protein